MTDQAEEPAARPSRGAKKRAVAVFEALAMELADMPLRQFSQIELPEVLREEVALARRTRGGGSRKRQAKFLAGVLRRYEEATKLVVPQLERLHVTHHTDTVLFHAVEELRDRVCDPDQQEHALHEVHALFPELDLDRLAHLGNQAHAYSDRKSKRELFRILRMAQEKADLPGSSLQGAGPKDRER